MTRELRVRSGDAKRLKGVRNEERVLGLLLRRIGDPTWLHAARKATPLEDQFGRDVVCVTDVGTVYVQVKSSQHYADKFLAGYARGKRGVALITLVVVDDEETEDVLIERILADICKVRHQVQLFGRPLVESWKQYGFALTRTLDDPRAMVDSDRFADLLRWWSHSEFRPAWALELLALPSTFVVPQGTLFIRAEDSVRLVLLPMREQDGVAMVRQAVGSRSLFSDVLLPFCVPENADETWFTEQLYGPWSNQYTRVRRRMEVLISAHESLCPKRS